MQNDVFKFAMRIMEETTLTSLSKCGLDSEAIDVLFPQANIRIIDAAVTAGPDKDKVLVNVQWYGNTSAASVPIALMKLYGPGR